MYRRSRRLFECTRQSQNEKNLLTNTCLLGLIHILHQLDGWGREAARHSLLAGTFLLQDETTREVFLLRGDQLFDQDGELVLELEAADQNLLSAHLNSEILALGRVDGSISLYDIRNKTLERIGCIFA